MLKKYILFFFLVFINCVGPKKSIWGKVTSVKDGDTIEILHLGKPEKIRLYGIDAPEKKQAYGNRSKQFTSEFCFGKEVKVIVHGYDKYGRTLGEVILGNGRNLNKELIKAGLAWRYKYSTNKEFEALEVDARKAKRGLWSDPNAINPWNYRRKK